MANIKKLDPIIRDVLKWHNHNQYIRIGSDVSVTELMMPPQIVHLRNRHKQTITITDLNNEIPSISGTAIHKALQHYLRMESNVSGKWLIERKMCAIINGQRIAGKFDALYDLKQLYDIKTVRVWKYIFGGVTEFEQQLNMYDYMLYLDGYNNIEILKVWLIFGDWMAGKIWEKGYPQERTHILPIKKWTRKEQKDYIESRLDLWQKSQGLSDADLPHCTLEERWADKEVYKLFKHPTSKRAAKNFNTMTGAKSYQSVCAAKDPNGWIKSYIKTFRSQPWKRCGSWCQVQPYCHQYRNK